MGKHILVMAIVALASTGLKAQSVTIDSVSIGSANEAWYKLSTGQQSSQARGNWDLGFTTNGYDVTILFNHSAGNRIYIANGATPATFTAVTQADTSATPLFNSDSTWMVGALNQQASGTYNYGWGSYNTSTHQVSGNRVFIVKYPGNVFKKCYIQQLSNTSIPYTYTLVYANIDNSGQQTVSIAKQTYGTKNFVYYSFATNAIVDREPAKTDWDLLFTKYTTTSELYMGSANQVVAGVLQNKGVLAAQANGVANPATYTSYAAHTFSTAANVLGWDWKGLNAAFQYTVEPARVYFVKDLDGAIYKMIFMSYTGGASGKFKFSKERMNAVSTAVNESGTVFVQAALFPNPVADGPATLIYTATETVAGGELTMTDVSGKVIFRQAMHVSEGMNQQLIDTNGLPGGMYFLQLKVNGYHTTQKLIKY